MADIKDTQEKVFKEHFNDYYELDRKALLQASMSGQLLHVSENMTIRKLDRKLEEAIKRNAWAARLDQSKVATATVSPNTPAPPAKKPSINPFRFFSTSKPQAVTKVDEQDIPKPPSPSNKS